MGGLLYKDFVSVNRLGKIKVTWGILFLLVCYTILRMVFPGTTAYPDFVATNEQGQMVNILDVMFVSVFVLIILAFIILLNGFVSKVVDGDDKNKIKGYLAAMPIEKNTYVAAKYIFIGIVAYVFLSVSFVYGIVCSAFCENGPAKKLANMILGFVTFFMSITLLSAALELPLFILLGKEKAQLIKIGIWTVIALVAIGYVMFGNLNWITSGLNMELFLDFLNEHKDIVMILQSLGPVIILVLYYVSYCITSHFFKRR